MRRYSTFLLAIGFCLMALSPALAQQTGSFSITLNVNGVDRQVAVYVPTTYDEAVPHKLMVALHGLGDNPTNYRNGLVHPSINYNGAFPQTIFICPNTVNQFGDHFTPNGSEAVIEECIQWVNDNYNLDESEITLQGFSLGGRSALKYGLENPGRFKGLFLATPAIQGVKDAKNEIFPYHQAPQIPIYITHGGQDVTYTGPIDTMFEQLVRNNGIAKFRRFPTQDHQLPAGTDVNEFYSFLETPANAEYDIDIVRLYAPRSTCDATVGGTVLVRNTGEATVTSIQFAVDAGGSTQNFDWTGSLAPWQHAAIALPQVPVSEGGRTLHVEVGTLNGTVTDPVEENNQQEHAVRVFGTGKALPYLEGLNSEETPEDWTVNPSGDILPQFFVDEDAKSEGSHSIVAFNTLLLFENSGRYVEVAAPPLNLTSAEKPELMFDYAFNYHKFTADVLGIDLELSDTLEILLSGDCGKTYQSVFKKGGKDLATFAEPILNPIDFNQVYVVPADTQWRSQMIDLGAVAQSQTAMVKFRYISGLGGLFFLDNIRVGDKLSHTKETLAGKTLKVYPNPATHRIHMDLGTERAIRVDIMDASGKVVLHQANSHPGGLLALDVAHLDRGLYIIRAVTENGSYTGRVVLE